MPDSSAPTLAPETPLRAPSGGFFAKANLAWQVVGGALLAPILLTVLITARLQEWDIPTYAWLLWLQLPILMVHEFEEYVFPGGFKSFFNHDTVFSSENPTDNTPLSEGYVFFVNIVTVWGWAIVGALLAGIAPWVGFGLVVFNAGVNCVQHSVIFQIKHEGYNPGLFTTMLLLLPFSTFITIYVIQHDVMSPLDWVLSFVLGLGVVAGFAAITGSRRKVTA
ncbi:MAG: HXXEE domain-containing protein [Actinobacteria bacterium]|nr:HXXEE domain-containing protein [Actinomycetota bacterium]MCB9413014.1 HXXEE domain-containing protein [Actinomycetota bacterium]